MLQLTINGEPRQFARALNCEQLLAQMNLAGKKVAVECNGEIVPRSRLGSHLLKEGDTLEIVVAVGGG